MADLERLKSLRPENVLKKIGNSSPVLLVNSRPVFQALCDEKIIIMACNIRIKHVIPGIMKAADELDAIVAFELAKSEGDVDGGYTGQTPEIFVNTILEYAQALNYRLPFIIHGDHITVKDTSEKAIESARLLIAAEMKAGYSSYAIDASHNEDQDNIRITIELAKPIMDAGLGLEAEVGEIKLIKEGGALTTVDEALTFIQGLKDMDVHPVLLATNNGSKHGNYAPGEEVYIDLKRTGEIYEAIKGFGVSIAQHGITGTPLHMVGRFAEYGIRKGNVGTLWQNIAYKGLPPALLQSMKDWAEKESKDIKFANKVFKSEIDSIPESARKRIEDMAYHEAREFIKAFRGEGSARRLLEKIS